MKYLTTNLNEIPWVSHGFFTRAGGTSEGIYASLNCGPGSGDDLDCVRANRAKVAGALGVENVVTLWQVHSARVVNVTRALPREELPQGDALVTATPGLGIGILTADCAPVLFASGKDRVVGAAHAGWKGALGGVLEATVGEMKKLGARDIEAALGPCIGPNSYEVGGDFPAPFLAQDKKNEVFFTRAQKPGHFMFDLPAYTAARLKAAGVAVVHDVRQDTLANEQAYFSYRRACLRGEKSYGRQLSAIAVSG
jgi:YfiH family protein